MILSLISNVYVGRYSKKKKKVLMDDVKKLNIFVFLFTKF